MKLHSFPVATAGRAATYGIFATNCVPVEHRRMRASARFRGSGGVAEVPFPHLDPRTVRRSRKSSFAFAIAVPRWRF